MIRGSGSLRRKATVVVFMTALFGLPAARPQTASADYLTSIREAPSALIETATFWDPRDLPAAGCDDGCAYMIGGHDNGRGGDLEYSNRIVKYNPKTNIHTFANTLIPTPGMSSSPLYIGRAAMGVAFDGSYAYLFGGKSCYGYWAGTYGGGGSDYYNCIFANDVLRYDPVADSLSVMPSSFTYNIFGSSAVWANGAAYLFGGATEDSYCFCYSELTTITRYDPSTGTLAEVASLPNYGPGVTAVSTTSGVYLFGGTEVSRFDPHTHTLSYVSSLSPSGDQFVRARNFAAGVWDGQDVYLFGGNSGTTCCYFDRPTGNAPVGPFQTANDLTEEVFYYDDVLRFDPSATTLIRMSAKFAFARSHMSAVSDGTQAYVFGGCSAWRCPRTGFKYELRPGIPQVVLAMSRPGGIAISWQPPPANTHSTAITGFKIYRGYQVDRVSTYLATVGPGQLEYMDASCPKTSITCYYAISALTAQGEGVRSLPTAGFGTF